VKEDGHCVESVVRADAILDLEGGEVLVVRRKVWALKPDEHEHATRRLEAGLQVLEAVTDITGKHGKSFLAAHLLAK
jgi:hypothetical protein